jgi:hypothetical protein
VVFANLSAAAAQGDVGPQRGQSRQSNRQESAPVHDLILALCEKSASSFLNDT